MGPQFGRAVMCAVCIPLLCVGDQLCHTALFIELCRATEGPAHHTYSAPPFLSPHLPLVRVVHIPVQRSSRVEAGHAPLAQRHAEMLEPCPTSLDPTMDSTKQRSQIEEALAA